MPSACWVPSVILAAAFEDGICASMVAPAVTFSLTLPEAIQRTRELVQELSVLKTFSDTPSSACQRARATWPEIFKLFLLPLLNVSSAALATGAATANNAATATVDLSVVLIFTLVSPSPNLGFGVIPLRDLEVPLHVASLAVRPQRVRRKVFQPLVTGHSKVFFASRKLKLPIWRIFCHIVLYMPQIMARNLQGYPLKTTKTWAFMATKPDPRLSGRNHKP